MGAPAHRLRRHRLIASPSAQPILAIGSELDAIAAGRWRRKPLSAVAAGCSTPSSCAHPVGHLQRGEPPQHPWLHQQVVKGFIIGLAVLLESFKLHLSSCS